MLLSHWGGGSGKGGGGGQRLTRHLLIWKKGRASPVRGGRSTRQKGGLLRVDLEEKKLLRLRGGEHSPVDPKKIPSPRPGRRTGEKRNEEDIRRGKREGGTHEHDSLRLGGITLRRKSTGNIEVLSHEKNLAKKGRLIRLEGLLGREGEPFKKRRDIFTKDSCRARHQKGQKESDNPARDV